MESRFTEEKYYWHRLHNQVVRFNYTTSTLLILSIFFHDWCSFLFDYYEVEKYQQVVQGAFPGQAGEVCDHISIPSSYEYCY